MTKIKTFDKDDLIILRNALVRYMKYLDQERPDLLLATDKLLSRVNELLLSKVKEENRKMGWFFD